jgi:hypothetical protein
VRAASAAPRSLHCNGCCCCTRRAASCLAVSSRTEPIRVATTTAIREAPAAATGAVKRPLVLHSAAWPWVCLERTARSRLLAVNPCHDSGCYCCGLRAQAWHWAGGIISCGDGRGAPFLLLQPASPRVLQPPAHSRALFSSVQARDASPFSATVSSTCPDASPSFGLAFRGTHDFRRGVSTRQKLSFSAPPACSAAPRRSPTIGMLTTTSCGALLRGPGVRSRRRTR